MVSLYERALLTTGNIPLLPLLFNSYTPFSQDLTAHQRLTTRSNTCMWMPLNEGSTRLRRLQASQVATLWRQSSQVIQIQQMAMLSWTEDWMMPQRSGVV